MIQPVSYGPNARLHTLDFGPEENNESSASAHPTPSPHADQQQSSGAPAQLAIMNRDALFISLGRSPAAAPVTGAVNGTANPVTRTQQTPTPATTPGDRGAWGWIQHTAGLVTSTVMGAVKSAFNLVTQNQRTQDANTSTVGGWIDSKVNLAEQWVDSGRTWLSQHGGVPGKIIADQIGFQEGGTISLYGMAKGLVQMGYGAAQLVNPVEWVANPQANVQRLQSTWNAVTSMGKIANLTNPVSWITNGGDNTKLVTALWDSGVKSYQSDPAKFAGNAAVTVGTLFIPGGGEEALASDAAKFSATADDVTAIVDAGDVAPVLTQGSGSVVTQDATSATNLTQAPGLKFDLPGSQLQTGARQLIKNVNSADAWDKADAIYDTIRADSTDVNAISHNTGMPTTDIQQIKDHVFFNDHQLDSGVRRFDADPQIANAWSRLSQGDFVQSDIDLLKHELFESNYEAAHGVDYRTAHTATIDAGYTWNPGPGE